MANLIITIISIALVAAVAIVGALYVSNNFGTWEAGARASTLISQSRQIYTADTQYLTDKGLSTFGDFNIDLPIIANYLVKPDILGLPARSNTVPCCGTSSSATYHHTCANDTVPTTMDGNGVYIQRTIGYIAGVSVVAYNFTLTSASSTNCYAASGSYTNAASATNPIVQMCLKINSMTTLPSGLTYAANGLPNGTGNGQYLNGLYYYDGANQFNYCYIGPASITYVFAN
jgi:hypothetical protein